MSNKPTSSSSSDPLSLIPLRVVTAFIGAGKSFVYDQMRDGRFPKPIIQRDRFTRWRLGDIQDWARDPSAWKSEATAAES